MPFTGGALEHARGGVLVRIRVPAAGAEWANAKPNANLVSSIATLASLLSSRLTYETVMQVLVPLVRKRRVKVAHRNRDQARLLERLKARAQLRRGNAGLPRLVDRLFRRGAFRRVRRGRYGADLELLVLLRDLMIGAAKPVR